jgi:hypothetical protein
MGPARSAGPAGPRRGSWAWLPARGRAYLKEPGQAARVLFGSFLTFVWSHLEPAKDATPVASIAPSDNLQTPMNLVMPLRFPQVAFRAELGKALFYAADGILAGLNNVGTVHFARFDIIDGNLCMFSIFDGDFRGYIRDFIGAIGDAFDQIMGFVQDPPTIPCGQNVDEFVEWVRSHDSLQVPELPTDITPDLVALRRRDLLLLYRNKNVQVGVYRGYPGFSVAQIREALGIGW